MSEMKVTSTQLIHQANQAVDADLAKFLPYLRAMDDEAAVRALRELYDIAFNAAFKASDGVIKDMGGAPVEDHRSTPLWQYRSTDHRRR